MILRNLRAGRVRGCRGWPKRSSSRMVESRCLDCLCPLSLSPGARAGRSEDVCGWESQVSDSWLAVLADTGSITIQFPGYGGLLPCAPSKLQQLLSPAFQQGLLTTCKESPGTRWSPMAPVLQFWSCTEPTAHQISAWGQDRGPYCCGQSAAAGLGPCN